MFHNNDNSINDHKRAYKSLEKMSPPVMLYVMVSAMWELFLSYVCMYLYICLYYCILQEFPPPLSHLCSHLFP